MKFAREFREALVKEGFPPHWVASAVPYGQLKKCLKKVQSELQSLGLDPDTLAQLSSPSRENEAAGNGAAFQYDFEGEKTFLPKLTFFIHLENGVAVDASLSSNTRKCLETLAMKQQSMAITKLPENGDPSSSERPSSSGDDASQISSTSSSGSDTNVPGVQRVEVPLTFDAEFFDLLRGDLSILDSLQAQEQKALTDEIENLSTDIKELAKPSKFSKTDLYRWRELFEIYLQANVFFSTHEVDHGSRTSEVAAKQLGWFQAEVVKKGILEQFKLPASRQALNRFIAINITLLHNLKFQEINQKAISKILKKFDKRTQLGATKTFPKLIKSDMVMSGNMAKAVCSTLTTDLVKVVPQLDDFLCPICFAIVWRPIRMKCKHIICIRCTVLLQRQHKRMCPLCRENVILEADEDNIDEELGRYLRKYFPKEVKEKQIQHEIADGIERFGQSYKHPSQQKCHMM